MSATQYERSVGGLNAAVAAAGNSQSTATAITAGKNIVTSATGTSADGLRLSASLGAGEIVYIANTTDVALDVFPPTDGAINGGSANAAVVLRANSMGVYMSLGGGNWAATIDVDTDT
jgi:4-diphosphocytidyl-2C-methyl-D-erythritol kinase